MHNVVNLHTIFTENKPDNHIKLFTSLDKSRVAAAIEYVQHVEEENPAHNFKCAEFDNGDQLRGSLEAKTLLGKLKAADMIRIDEIYDLRADETQQVVTALQEALCDGKLVILSGDPVSMEKFMSAQSDLKAEAASLPAVRAKRRKHNSSASGRK